jgi:uncharacterized membrane protein
MAPLFVQLVATLVARTRLAWPAAVRVGLAVMIMFTGVSHFTSLGRDMANMIPPPLTGAMWVIHLTGVLELAGAVGLLVPATRRAAGICLIILIAAMFPANVYAALQGVTLGGRPATALWLRTPMQLFWLWALWWSSVRRAASSAIDVPARSA